MNKKGFDCIDYGANYEGIWIYSLPELDFINKVLQVHVPQKFHLMMTLRKLLLAIWLVENQYTLFIAPLLNYEKYN